MKIYANLLALSSIAGASAFVAQSSAFTKSSSILKASYSYSGDALGQKEKSTSSTVSPVADSSPAEMIPVSSEDIWSDIDTLKIQGDTLRTCSFSEGVERVEVLMKTNGRPLNAVAELWQGHHNDPQRIRVYLEDGAERNLRVTFEAPGSSNSVAIRNIGSQEYPLTAGVEADFGGAQSTGSPADILSSMSEPRLVQGGAVYTLPFDPEVESIQVMLESDGRPMNARVELLQGPNNVKQAMDIYSENGCDRPLYVIMDSPGTGNVVRIKNTATVEYPLSAFIEPYLVDEAFVEGSTGVSWT